MTTDQENEIWSKVPGMNYEASNLGNLRHSKTHRTKKSYDNGRGYLSFVSYAGGIKIRYVHRCVLMAFHNRPDADLLQVNHKDFNRSNNKLSNLEWVSAKRNLNYSRLHGKYKNANKEHSEWMKENSALKKLGFKSKEVLAIQDTSIIEFKSQVECAKYFNASTTTISACIKSGKSVNGHNLHRI